MKSGWQNKKATAIIKCVTDTAFPHMGKGRIKMPAKPIFRAWVPSVLPFLNEWIAKQYMSLQNQGKGKIKKLTNIWQCVTFKIKSRPQKITDSVTGNVFVGMTQLITVDLSNIRDDDQMFYKAISPEITLEKTLATTTYSTQSGSTWGVSGKLSGSQKNGFSGEGSGSYNHSSVISNQTTYVSSALTISTRDYLEESNSAEWVFDYISEKSGKNGTKNVYLTSTTTQSASIGWQGPKNAAYYYAGFKFTISADFGIADYKSNDRKQLSKGNYVFGSNTVISDAYNVYTDFTEFAK